MATDRERAEKVWRDAYGAYLAHRAEPGPRPHSEAAAVIERALAPTDEEREAMRDVRAAVRWMKGQRATRPDHDRRRGGRGGGEVNIERDGEDLIADVRPLPCTANSGRWTEAFVASTEEEIRELVRALLEDGVSALQVRVDLTTLADGFLEVEGSGPSGAGVRCEALDMVRYLRRAADRIEKWVERARDGVPVTSDQSEEDPER